MKEPFPTGRFRALDGVERVTCLIMVLAMTVLVVVVNVQVVSRYLFDASLHWTYELVQYSFVWMVFIGAGVGIRRGLHLRIDLIEGRLSAGARRALGVVVDLVCLVVAVVFLIAGSIVAWRTWLHTSPAIGLPIGLIYVVFPLSGLGLLLFLAESIYRRATGRDDTHGPGEGD